ncbi:MAG: methyltransferase domain-containing protein [Emcibacter sp.]|nr:methyltransferase domain-containing protein [Emcibacter sp.]
MKIKTLILLWLSLLVGTMTPSYAEDKNAEDKNYDNLIQAAVDNPVREESDRIRDVNRKPAEIIKFMGIKPGMTVMEMLAGSGYYAEILSHVVGDEGKVIALNNQSYMGYTKDALIDRMAQKGRMENVELRIAEINDVELIPDELDALFLVLAYHDFYYVDEKNGWPKVDVERTLGQIYKSLKKGGVLAIVDHAAQKGSPHETGSTLHRIDPEIVKAELTAAGFTLEAESDLLANRDDNMTIPMFDETISGKTNRFVYRFVKK